MKQKFFSILAVMLMSLTANAEKTITWDYNTIKGIYYNHNEHEQIDGANPPHYSVFSKDGITLYVSLWYFSGMYLKNCNWGTETNWDFEGISFCSEVGHITSITITYTDGKDAFYEDNKGWTVGATSATWTGKDHEVILRLWEKREIQGIQQISFTVDEELIYYIDVYHKVYNAFHPGMPDGWSANKDLNHIAAGESVTFTTVVPEGKKIESLRAYNQTTGVSIYLTDNGDGTWTLPSMPKCNLEMLIGEYVDEGSVGVKYTISNIPDGWKVNGSTTSGTYEASEGAKVIFTPANIPAGKKIKSIKAVKQ